MHIVFRFNVISKPSCKICQLLVSSLKSISNQWIRFDSLYQYKNNRPHMNFSQFIKDETNGKKVVLQKPKRINKSSFVFR